MKYVSKWVEAKATRIDDVEEHWIMWYAFLQPHPQSSSQEIWCHTSGIHNIPPANQWARRSFQQTNQRHYRENQESGKERLEHGIG